MIISFFLISLIILFSTLGYGYFFCRIVGLENINKNIGLIGFLGLFFLSIISSYTHIITPHNYIFNISIIILGILFSIYNFYKYNLNILDFKNVFFIFLFFFVAIILSKNNEDYSYYHLPNAIHFAQNKLEFGLGNLNHGFKHISTLFLMMSLNYLPVFEHYLFNITNYSFYVFLITFLIFEIYKPRSHNLNFSNIFLLLLLILFLVKFSRLAEFGSDISGQIVLCLYIFFLIEFIFNKNLKFHQKDLYLKLSLLFLVFAVTLKFIHIIYSIPLFFLILITKQKKEYLVKIIKIRYSIFILFPIIFLIFFNFASTGCLIYPVSKTCFYHLDWSLSFETVKNLNLHYETWAKGGKGPNFEVNNPTDYVNSLNWISNWFNVYFFNKFSDFILVIISILFVTFIVFFKDIKKKTKILKKEDSIFLYFYIFISFIFITWFLNFPTLRYAGYIIIFLLIVLPFSKFLNHRINMKKKNSFNNITILILISYSIFFVKNSSRLLDELNKSYNDHNNFKNFPFYWVENVKYDKIDINGFKVYKVNSKCWDVPTPCVRNVDSLNIKTKKGYKFYSIKNDK